jgi:hypothetical protein
MRPVQTAKSKSRLRSKSLQSSLQKQMTKGSKNDKQEKFNCTPPHTIPLNKPFFLLLPALIIFTIALASCSNGSTGGSKPPVTETPTARSSGTEKALSFGTNCKVTIKSDDKFTNAEWNTLCDKVATMIKRGYDAASAGGKSALEIALGAGNVKAVILVNNLAHNWETKASEPGVLYIKTASIDSIDSGAAIGGMLDGTDAHG